MHFVFASINCAHTVRLQRKEKSLGLKPPTSWQRPNCSRPRLAAWAYPSGLAQNTRPLIQNWSGTIKQLATRFPQLMLMQSKKRTPLQRSSITPIWTVPSELLLPTSEESWYQRAAGRARSSTLATRCLPKRCKCNPRKEPSCNEHHYRASDSPIRIAT